MRVARQDSVGRAVRLSRVGLLLVVSITSAKGGAAAPQQGVASEQETTARVDELPREVVEALSTVTDLSFDFDQPGFYAVLDHVLRTPEPAGFAAAAQRVEDWRAMLERPRYFRGRAVRVEGTVGRNSSWAVGHRDGGARPAVWQIELGRADQPLACTVIFARPADDLPLGATIEVAGYFVLARQYYDAGGRVRQAALLVARGPLSVGGTLAAEERGSRFSWQWMLGAAGLGFAIAWVVLRRGGLGKARTNLRELQARQAAPESLAEELRHWAEERDAGDAARAERTAARAPEESGRE